MGYYGKKMTKQQLKEDAAIWRLSRKKAALTIARTKLIETGLKDHPDVSKVISLLEIERRKLDTVCAFD